MGKEIRIGIIGCGNIISAHLNGFKQLKDKNLLDDIYIDALCDMNKDRALSFREKGKGPAPFPGAGPENDPMNQPHVWVSEIQDKLPEVFTDYKEMIEKTEVNTIWVCTPVFTHYEIAMYGMEKGLNVFLEKPMAVSVKAARKMVEKANSAGVTFGIAESFHYMEAARIKAWAVAQGYIGKPQLSLQIGTGGFYAPDLIVGNTAWRHKKLIAGGG
jgi:1,5-anhydro-D-fructose reductase (1,5-anhydro-D-mannitol-forming)